MSEALRQERHFRAGAGLHLAVARKSAADARLDTRIRLAAGAIMRSSASLQHMFSTSR